MSLAALMATPTNTPRRDANVIFAFISGLRLGTAIPEDLPRLFSRSKPKASACRSVSSSRERIRCQQCRSAEGKVVFP